MNFTAVTLKPIDYFPLVSFYKEQGVSPIPRFTKPTADCMKSFAAVKLGTKIIALAGVFPTGLVMGNATVKAAYVGKYAAILDNGEIVSALAGLISKMMTDSGCIVFFGEKCVLTDALGFKSTVHENVYTLTRQSMGIEGQDIVRVFAFVDFNVIADEDLEQLKRVYASTCHYKICDNDFRPAMTSQAGKPVVVKDSMGKVTALFRVSDGSFIHGLCAQNPNDIADILRAYMILQGLENVKIRALPCDKEICKAIAEISEGYVCLPTMVLRANDDNGFEDGVAFPAIM